MDAPRPDTRTRLRDGFSGAGAFFPALFPATCRSVVEDILTFAVIGGDRPGRCRAGRLLLAVNQAVN